MSDLGDQIAIFALVTSIVSIIFSAVSFYFNSKDQRRAARVSTFAELMNQIGNQKARDSRRSIRKSKKFQDFLKDPALPLPEISNEETEAFQYVASTYDRLGFILKKDIELETEILDMHGDVIAEMWKTLCPFVMERRKTHRLYTTQFERIGKIAISIESRVKNNAQNN